VLSRFRSIDFPGFFLFSGAVIQLLLAIQWGGIVYAWNSSVVIGLFVGAGLTLAITVGWFIFRGDKAALPPSVLSERPVYLGFLVGFFGNGGYYVILYYLQIWFQAVKGVSPLKSGIMYLPTVGADIIGAIGGGAIGK
jgi:hypothetical protein